MNLQTDRKKANTRNVLAAMAIKPKKLQKKTPDAVENIGDKIFNDIEKAMFRLKRWRNA